MVVARRRPRQRQVSLLGQELLQAQHRPRRDGPLDLARVFQAGARARGDADAVGDVHRQLGAQRRPEAGRPEHERVRVGFAPAAGGVGGQGGVVAAEHFRDRLGEGQVDGSGRRDPARWRRIGGHHRVVRRRKPADRGRSANRLPRARRGRHLGGSGGRLCAEGDRARSAGNGASPEAAGPAVDDFADGFLEGDPHVRPSVDGHPLLVDGRHRGGERQMDGVSLPECPADPAWPLDGHQHRQRCPRGQLAQRRQASVLDGDRDVSAVGAERFEVLDGATERLHVYACQGRRVARQRHSGEQEHNHHQRDHERQNRQQRRDQRAPRTAGGG